MRTLNVTVERKPWDIFHPFTREWQMVTRMETEAATVVEFAYFRTMGEASLAAANRVASAKALGFAVTARVQ